MTPQRTFYPSFNMASTRAAIRSTPVEDFYVVPSENLPDGSVGFRILVNPLVWWMWVAGPVLVLGTVFALWPQASRETARATALAPTLSQRERELSTPTPWTPRTAPQVGQTHQSAPTGLPSPSGRGAGGKGDG
jgi:Cytochrome c-type biogenesis protein CcmF C-terminal